MVCNNWESLKSHKYRSVVVQLEQMFLKLTENVSIASLNMYMLQKKYNNALEQLSHHVHVNVSDQIIKYFWLLPVISFFCVHANGLTFDKC